LTGAIIAAEIAMARLRRLRPIVIVLILVQGAAAPRQGRAAPPAPQLYQVTLPAADRAARTALTSQGIAIDAIGPDTITTVVDARQARELYRLGLTPLAVAPLDFPPEDDVYHNYAEMVAAVWQAAAAYPAITRAYTVGVSLEGPPIPAVNINE
jgi:hypothetical protein